MQAHLQVLVLEVIGMSDRFSVAVRVLIYVLVILLPASAFATNVGTSLGSEDATTGRTAQVAVSTAHGVANVEVSQLVSRNGEKLGLRVLTEDDGFAEVVEIDTRKSRLRMGRR